MTNPLVDFSIKRNGVEIALTTEECWDAYEKIKEIRFYDFCREMLEEEFKAAGKEINEAELDKCTREMSYQISEELPEYDGVWEYVDIEAGKYLDKFRTEHEED